MIGEIRQQLHQLVDTAQEGVDGCMAEAGEKLAEAEAMRIAAEGLIKEARARLTQAAESAREALRLTATAEGYGQAAATGANSLVQGTSNQATGDIVAGLEYVASGASLTPPLLEALEHVDDADTSLAGTGDTLDAAQGAIAEGQEELDEKRAQIAQGFDGIRSNIDMM